MVIEQNFRDAVLMKFPPQVLNNAQRRAALREAQQAIGILHRINNSFLVWIDAYNQEEDPPEGMSYDFLFKKHLQWWNQTVEHLAKRKKYKFISIDAYWFYKAYSEKRELDHKAYQSVSEKKKYTHINAK